VFQVIRIGTATGLRDRVRTHGARVNEDRRGSDEDSGNRHFNGVVLHRSNDLGVGAIGPGLQRTRLSPRRPKFARFPRCREKLSRERRIWPSARHWRRTCRAWANSAKRSVRGAGHDCCNGCESCALARGVGMMVTRGSRPVISSCHLSVSLALHSG
jgi:hypothetical protein